ncbi:dihydrodipicolinate synthase family protein [Aureliella helgolandensis]|nr:dihydrodipicolinate synthase family protein [Aureliella helgolandensis]
MQTARLNGLIAATYTPMNTDGDLELAQVAPLVERLLDDGVQGLYVCGSTGEGMSLSTAERKATTEAFITANAGRVPLIVQVGHNSLADARDLAQHAAQAGADIVSATCPSYFKANDIPTLVECIADIAAAAPNTPFYYYHIPGMTGSTIDIVRLLEAGIEQVPNLVGLKYTDTKLFEFQACQAVADGKLDIVFGCDEMLLGALATGATAAIGSTYNVIAPIYLRIIEAFVKNDLTAAREEQMRSIEFIRLMNTYPFHSGIKEMLRLQGVPMGRCRLPQQQLTSEQCSTLKQDLQDLGLL